MLILFIVALVVLWFTIGVIMEVLGPWAIATGFFFIMVSIDDPWFHVPLTQDQLVIAGIFVLPALVILHWRSMIREARAAAEAEAAEAAALVEAEIRAQAEAHLRALRAFRGEVVADRMMEERDGEGQASVVGRGLRVAR